MLGLVTMTRDEAYQLVTDWTKNPNLVKHMLAVEAQMRALAKHFGENEDDWGLAGLIHDADYEKWPKEHPQHTLDELTGLIIACALVQPDKKLSAVTLESVKKKWKKKDFAAGVHREQIALCEEKLGIKLDDFINLCLKALQDIAPKLGL